MFKTESNTAAFARVYAQQVSLLKKLPGAGSISEGKVIGSPGGQGIYHLMVEVPFEDFAALDTALNSPEGVTAGKHLMSFAARRVEILFVESAQALLKPLTPRDLQAYLDSHQIPAEIVYPGAPTPSVPAAAQALGVETDQIVKSVVFLVNDKPFLIYGCGTQRADPRKIAARLNVNRKQVRLANADQVLEITGYAVGTVPPVGLKTSMPVLMDPAVQQHQTVYAGGGGIDALLKISSADLLRLSEAEIVPLLQDNTAE
jgi:uncharacterized protein (TIGR02118 family)